MYEQNIYTGLVEEYIPSYTYTTNTTLSSLQVSPHAWSMALDNKELYVSTESHAFVRSVGGYLPGIDFPCHSVPFSLPAFGISLSLSIFPLCFRSHKGSSPQITDFMLGSIEWRYNYLSTPLISGHFC